MAFIPTDWGITVSSMRSSIKKSLSSFLKSLIEGMFTVETAAEAVRLGAKYLLMDKSELRLFEARVIEKL